jgi:hypothetical protein
MSEAKIVKHDPRGENEALLREELLKAEVPDAGEREDGDRHAKPKPTHYKVVCISLYTRDIENLEATVAELKRRGYTKANKSQLIRMALNQLDIDKLPPPGP